MSEMSDYLEDKLINHIFRTTAYTRSAVLAHALMTTIPVDSDDGIFVTGGTGVEVNPSGNNYVRVDHPPLDANWNATSGSDGKTSNATLITWPAVTGSNWGTIVAIAICDDVLYNTGNMLLYTELNSPQVANIGATVSFAAGTPGALTCTFD